jgi:hypothetical protein
MSAAFFIILAVSVSLRIFSGFSVSGAELIRDDGAAEKIALPYVDHHCPPGARLSFSVTLKKRFISPRWIRIVPDDHFLELRVNGSPVPLAGINPSSLNDWRKGFRVRVGSLLRTGDNRLELFVQNSNGDGGIDVGNDSDDPLMAFLEALIWISGAAFLFCLAAATGVPPVFALITVTGIAVRVLYLRYTPWDVRGHDAYSHIDYVKFIFDKGYLPEANQGFEFYHPPLYYILAALQWKVMALFGSVTESVRFSGLQIQALVFNLCFTILSALGLRNFLSVSGGDDNGAKRSLFLAGLALLVLWPSCVIHSVRIGNDSLFYLFGGAVFYFLSRWWKSDRQRDLLWAVVFAGTAMFVKTNALIFFLCGFILVIMRYRMSGGTGIAGFLRKAALHSAISCIGIGASIIPSVIRTFQGKQAHFLVANVGGISSSLAVGNGLENYLWFDLKTFLTTPFTHPFRDEFGRQWFWNYTFKTGLFGEFTYHGGITADIAIALSWLFLVILVLCIIGIAARRSGKWSVDAPSIVCLFVFFAGLAFMRMSAPLACSNDFRYILPVVLPMTVLCVRGIGIVDGKGFARLGIFFRASIWAFCTLSIAFFLSLL